MKLLPAPLLVGLYCLLGRFTAPFHVTRHFRQSIRLISTIPSGSGSELPYPLSVIDGAEIIANDLSLFLGT
jgi:hypothetical protein